MCGIRHLLSCHSRIKRILVFLSVNKYLRGIEADDDNAKNTERGNSKAARGCY